MTERELIMFMYGVIKTAGVSEEVVSKVESWIFSEEKKTPPPDATGYSLEKLTPIEKTDPSLRRLV